MHFSNKSNDYMNRVAVTHLPPSYQIMAHVVFLSHNVHLDLPGKHETLGQCWFDIQQLLPNKSPLTCRSYITNTIIMYWTRF